MTHALLHLLLAHQLARPHAQTIAAPRFTYSTVYVISPGRIRW